MFFSQHNIASAAAAILALLPSLLVSATPTPVDVYITKKPQHDLVFHEALELAHDISHQPHLEKRLSVDFSLDKTWESNHVLFAGSWINGDAALGITDTVSLAVTCIDCWTKGTVTAKLHEDIVDPSVRLDFSGVEAYVDIGVDITAGAAYAVNLFTSNSPLGLGFPGLSVGLVFYVDLVFSLSSEIDLEGGFYVKVADGAFLEASVFGGDITKSFFDGLSSKSLPVVVRKGSATFKADLRLRVQCGAEAGVPELGIGATAELGIYANLIEFVAVLESTPTCELQSTEWWDLNVGAFARFGVIIDYKTFGVVPTVSTTLLSAPTMTQCWLSKSPAESGTVMTVTTQPATMLSSATASASGGIIFTASSVYESGGSGGEVSVSATSVGTSGVVSSEDPAVTSPPVVSYPSSLTPNYPAGNSSGYPVYSTGGGIISSSAAEDDDLVTSTLYTTSLYTITSCAATVPNCPASLQSEIVVTKTVDLYTTICPATASITLPSSLLPTTTSVVDPASSTPTVTVIKDIIVLVPCATPTVETFTYTPPSTPLPVSSFSSFPAVVTPPVAVGNAGYQWPNGSYPSVYSTGTGAAAPSSNALPTQGEVQPPVYTAGTNGLRIGFASVMLVVVGGLMVVLM